MIIVTHSNGITAVYGQCVNLCKVTVFVLQHNIKHIVAVLQFSVAARSNFRGDPVLTENIRIQIPTAGGNGYLIQKGDAVCCIVDKHKNICSGDRRAFDLRDLGDIGVYRDPANRRLSITHRCSDRSYTTANSRYFSVRDHSHGLIGTCPCYRFIRCVVRQDCRCKYFTFANL